MLRIVFGILLIVGMLSAFVTQSAPTFEDGAEMQGYVIAQIAFIALAIWLISSGIKKRRAKKQGSDKAGKVETVGKTKMAMVDFLKSFFGDYKAFLRKNIELKKPPYWLMVIWLYGVVRMLIRIDSSVGGIGVVSFGIHGWFDMWVSSLIFGSVIGLIGYWVIGSIFHLGVLLAGGHHKAKASRMVFVYSSIPHTIAVMALFFVGMLGLRGNYFLDGGLDPSWFHISMAASLYSIVLGYIGAREVQKTKKIRSILIFIVLPVLMHASIYFYSYAQSQRALDQLMQSVQEVQE